ncbi:MAG: M20/M25/M40 family metallo-hydrolase, partial [SAR202 cluster bacterium]|nr:M20/M25/M40 family metallo-hydrolase [SAR202 cluster bacterium]
AIAAARAIRLAGIELEGRLSIHSVVDEETGGSGAIDAVKKGHLAKTILVPEPTWGDIICAEGGLEWVRITIPGRSAHAGWRFNEIWPQHHTSDRLVPGVNAIELANRFLNALRNFERDRCRNTYHPLSPLGLATINPGVIRGGVGKGKDGLPIIMSNPAMVPDIVTLDLDYKFLPNERQKDIRKEFEEFVHNFSQADPWLKENPIKVQWELGGLYFPPMDTPIDHPLIQSLIKHNQKNISSPTIKAFEAVADVSHYAGAGVAGSMYGSTGDGFHGIDEYVEIQSMINTTEIIAKVMIDICGIK